MNIVRVATAVIAASFAVIAFLPVPATAQPALQSLSGSDVAAAGPAATPVFKTLYRFKGGKYGSYPNGGVVVHDGAIYGTTQYDGDCPTCGILYKLTENKGIWSMTVPHPFDEAKEDGIAPIAPLNISGSTLFGTTSAGANFDCGCGEVFQLVLPTGYKIIKHLTPSIGETPLGGLLIAADGTMYGATSGGGKHDGGVVYKVTKTGTYSVFYNLPGNPDNPASGPIGELIFGKDGAIYGTSYGGGKYNQGYVFRLTAGGSFKDLYDFKNNFEVNGLDDGAQPEGRLVLGGEGTIYGTTELGGTGYGTAWSLTPESNDTWKYKQLKIFGSDGNIPHSGLVALNGVLYGVGAGGGRYQSGVLFSFTKMSSGGWQYHLLHSFKALNPGGDDPQADLWISNGVIYGTTLTGGEQNSSCGQDGCGTVFEYIP